jgi:hypothetical protein
MALARDGRLLVSEQGSLTQAAAITALDTQTGAMETVADNWHGLPLNSPNDVVVARDGAIWFTDPSYGSFRASGPSRRCSTASTATTQSRASCGRSRTTWPAEWARVLARRAAATRAAGRRAGHAHAVQLNDLAGKAHYAGPSAIGSTPVGRSAGRPSGGAFPTLPATGRRAATEPSVASRTPLDERSLRPRRRAQSGRPWSVTR